MKIPRDLSGADLVRTLCRDWGYLRIHQVGSHIILQTAEPAPHRIAVPAHASLRIGTLNAILRAVAEHKGVTREDLLNTPVTRPLESQHQAKASGAAGPSGKRPQPRRRGSTDGSAPPPRAPGRPNPAVSALVSPPAPP